MIHPFNAVLILDDGACFYGQLLNEHGSQQGEICFNTGMTGYQEVISDPSYANQIVAFSFPHIGNVGTNRADNEGREIYLNGIILGDLPTAPTNHRHESDFLSWIRSKKVEGIWGIDTRTLIKKISTSKVPIKGKITWVSKALNSQELKEHLEEFKDINGLSGANLTTLTGTKKGYCWDKPEWSSSQPPKNTSSPKIGVFDFGVKENILRCLTSRGCEVHVFPTTISYQALLEAGIEGVVLSNGPGDPRVMKEETLRTIQQLIDTQIPILGICLGYQIIAFLNRARISQMGCGHHGINHPVKELETGKAMITSQNHEFVVDLKTLPNSLEPTHISLFDQSLEGFKVKEKPIIAVQFHPEANPGPHDAQHIFDDFINLVRMNA